MRSRRLSEPVGLNRRSPVGNSTTRATINADIPSKLCATRPAHRAWRPADRTFHAPGDHSTEAAEPTLISPTTAAARRRHRRRAVVGTHSEAGRNAGTARGRRELSLFFMTVRSSCRRFLGQRSAVRGPRARGSRLGGLAPVARSAKAGRVGLDGESLRA